MANSREYKCNVLFVKHDKYDNLVFSSTEDIDKDSYEMLKSLSIKLKEAYPDIYSPLYRSYDRISVRINPVQRYDFIKKDSIYKVSFQIVSSKKKKDNSIYIKLRMPSNPVFQRKVKSNETILDL